jgi:predicted nucleic acid-binding protein
MTYASEVTAKQRETIARQENIINSQAQAIDDLTNLVIRNTASFKRQMDELVQRIVHIEQAMLEEATRNKDIRVRFEAGYWGRIGE